MMLKRLLKTVIALPIVIAALTLACVGMWIVLVLVLPTEVYKKFEEVKK